jgi:hypothetical protein
MLRKEKGRRRGWKQTLFQVRLKNKRKGAGGKEKRKTKQNKNLTS